MTTTQQAWDLEVKPARDKYRDDPQFRHLVDAIVEFKKVHKFESFAHVLRVAEICAKEFETGACNGTGTTGECSNGEHVDQP